MGSGSHGWNNKEKTKCFIQVRMMNVFYIVWFRGDNNEDMGR